MSDVVLQIKKKGESFVAEMSPLYLRDRDFCLHVLVIVVCGGVNLEGEAR